MIKYLYLFYEHYLSNPLWLFISSFLYIRQECRCKNWLHLLIKLFTFTLCMYFPFFILPSFMLIICITCLPTLNLPINVRIRTHTPHDVHVHILSAVMLLFSVYFFYFYSFTVCLVSTFAFCCMYLVGGVKSDIPILVYKINSFYPSQSQSIKYSPKKQTNNFFFSSSSSHHQHFTASHSIFFAAHIGKITNSWRKKVLFCTFFVVGIIWAICEKMGKGF